MSDKEMNDPARKVEAKIEATHAAAMEDRSFGHGVHWALNMAVAGRQEDARKRADELLREGRQALRAKPTNKRDHYWARWQQYHPALACRPSAIMNYDAWKIVRRFIPKPSKQP